MNAPSRTFAPAALVAAALLLTAAGSPAPGTELDLEKIGREAEEAYDRDLAAQREVSFTRKVVRQSLDKDGNVTEKEVIVLRVTPTADGFDERLIELDGRAPTEREVRNHRKSGVEERHYRQLVEGRLAMSILGDITLPLLLSAYDFHFEGEEEIHGVRCYRFSVRPWDPPDGVELTVLMSSASEGDFWLTAEGSHLARMRTRIVRPLKALGMGLNAMELSVDSKPRGDAWLFHRFEVKSEYLALGTYRKHNIWTYSDYQDHP